MPISVKGSGGGGVTLDAGAAASNTTLTLPNVSGTVLQSGTAVTVAQGGTGATSLTANNVLLGNGTSAVQVVAPNTAGNVLTSDGTTWTSAAPTGGVPTPSAVGQIPFSTNGSTYTATAKIVSGTAVASTSGTSIDFTSIPSWVKRITVIFNEVSSSGSSFRLVQLGTGSTTFANTGYVATGCVVNASNSCNTNSSTAGFFIYQDNASYVLSGHMILTNISGNLWISSHSGKISTGTTVSGGGSVTLGAVLTGIRITSVNGTDTFDNGSINILYE